MCDRGHNRVQMFQQERHLRERIPRAAGKRSGLDRLDHVLARRGADLHDRGPTIRTANSTCCIGATANASQRTDASVIKPGEFDNLHNLGIDSKGNIYTAEVQGKRVQSFRNVGGL